MSPRVARDLRMSVAALAMGWFALVSWRGMVEQPFRFLWITLAGGLLLVTTGVLGRAFGRTWYAVLAGQLVVGTVFLNLVYARDRSWAGLVPTRASLTDLGDQVVSGAVAIGRYLAPVPSQHSGIYPYLVLLGLLVILTVDLLAAGLRHPPLAGLPALLALTVPISILDGGLPFVVFALTAIAFLVMLGESELDRLMSWGRSVAAGGRSWDETDERSSRGGTWAGSLRIGLVALVVAAALAAVIPVANDPFGLHDGGDGTNGESSTVVVNPLLNLKRDLTSPEPIPLLYVDADEPDPSYVRMTVLDEFTGRTWEPSARKLPAANKVTGAMPQPPGLAPAVQGRSTRWRLQLAEDFDSQWLPAPYPVTQVDVPGDWRYDERTFDFVTAKLRTGGLRYSLTAFSPDLTATALARSGSAPNSVVVPMTKLPPSTPSVFGRTAREVTAAGGSDYEKAVLLQNWFRDGNRFTYSTDRRPGSGMQLLAEFITTDRVGYCEQFAAAYAVLARSLGLPTRVVVGFLDGNEMRADLREFTTEDLHAWPEVYFSGLGWVRFEPTPGGRTGAAPPYTRQAVRPTPAGPRPSVAAPSRVPRTGENATGPDGSGGSGGLPVLGWLNWLGWTLLVILVLALAATPRLVRDVRRRRWLSASDAPGLANGAWSELLATATDAGLSLPDRATLRRLSAELVGLTRATAEQQRELAMLVEVVERARYARTYEADAEERRRIVTAVHSWNDVIMSAAPPRRRRWSSWWPQSLFSGPARIRVPDRAGAANAPRDGA